MTSTPTVKSVIQETKSAGGIMLSASHNPVEWNALKFIGKKGFFFQQKEIDAFREALTKELPKATYAPKSKFSSGEEFEVLHIESILKQVNASAIRKKKYTVLVDAVNGGGSFIVPRLLKQLGCKVIEIHCQPNGKFPRPPEPTLASLKKTSKLMRDSDADIGFALDPDADRLVVLTPTSGALSEEYTLPIAIHSPLLQPIRKKFAVINLSTSFLLQTVLDRYGKDLLRSKVGEANVVKMMQEKKAFFGGEGNGGVIDPKISSFGRDALAGIAHILNCLTQKKQTIDQLVQTLPEIYMQKTSFPIQGQNLAHLYEAFQLQFSSGDFDTRDGLRIDLQNKWIHLRPSNTEPIVRVIAEAKSKADLKSLLQKASEIVLG
ncbi:MAG: phosphoglucosamine mutase [Spirochaetota bacterium]